jgi:hypothetical protein
VLSSSWGDRRPWLYIWHRDLPNTTGSTGFCIPWHNCQTIMTVWGTATCRSWAIRTTSSNVNATHSQIHEASCFKVSSKTKRLRTQPSHVIYFSLEQKNELWHFTLTDSVVTPLKNMRLNRKMWQTKEPTAHAPWIFRDGRMTLALGLFFGTRRRLNVNFLGSHAWITWKLVQKPKAFLIWNEVSLMTPPYALDAVAI